MSKNLTNYYSCRWCWNKYPIDGFPPYECKTSHTKYCKSCITRHATKGNDYKWNQEIGCPCQSNICSLDRTQILFLLTDNDIEKLENREIRVALNHMKDLVYCPNPTCEAAYLKRKQKRGKKKCRKSTCESCETIFCGLCGELYTKEHVKMKCGLYNKWKLSNDENELKVAMKKKGIAKKCPWCHKLIEKNGGCRNIECTFCTKPFCWKCSFKQHYDSNHRWIDCQCEYY